MGRIARPGGPRWATVWGLAGAFLLGTAAYVATLLRGRQVPTVPLVLYATGAVPVALRAFVPELALDLGLVTLAVGIGWLATWLFQESGRITTRAVDRHPSSTMVETVA